MSLGGASSAGMSTGGGTAEKDKDKGGKGLRHFSMKVCEKVQSKMKTTYNEVADELVAEFSNPDDPRFCADQAYDEKNIRRRVYDALNVLMAMDIIAKEKKEIMWRGLPATSEGNVEHLHAELAAARASIEKKNAHLQELVEQYNSYQALLSGTRGGRSRCAGGGAEPVIGGIQLPFILVQTKPQRNGGGGDLRGPAGGALRLQLDAVSDPRWKFRPGEHEPRHGRSEPRGSHRRRRTSARAARGRGGGVANG